ncbi:MAG: polyphenol oxidase family protein [Bacteroidales bacterium]|nr:polyphenol oxidase family protein [Bacteroidales bacterium]
MLTFDNNIGLYKFQILQRYPGVLNFVTTRHRPDGTGSDFNIGFSGGPEHESLANRHLLARAVGVEPGRFVFMNQVHRDNCFVADASVNDLGFSSKHTAVKDTDILVTNASDVCLVTRSADCIPVLLYSPDSHSIAAAHSGREGTYLGVAAKAAHQLVDRYGAKADGIVACIGPGINGDCYEVDLDCAAKFLNDSRFAPDTIELRNGKAYLDLKKMIFYDLLTFGLVANNIEISDICTKCCARDFFSARRGETQRFCAGICLR